MARRERGLPADLTIAVPDDLLQPPSEVPPLKDFLEQAIATKAAAQRAGDALEGNTALKIDAEIDQPPARERPRRAKRRTWPPPRALPFQSHQSDDDRLQLRMSPEVRHALEALVGYFTRFGPNKRAPASDIIGALIMALDDARGELELGAIPRRGAYGTASAEAHRSHMKDAVADAIARHRGKFVEVV
jgi:hypothetical protein